MVPPPAILAPDITIANAASLLVAQGCATLPVVNAAGRFMGVFGAKELIGLSLPRAVRVGNDLADLGFVADNSGDLRGRLAALAGEPVSRYMVPHQTVRPETALAEALLLLHRGDAFLPVVDASGYLVGIVTAAGALRLIAGVA